MKTKGTLQSTAKHLKLGLVSAIFAGGIFVALNPVTPASAANYTNQSTRQLTDSEIYENAQKLDLPDYIHGSIYGILNQNSSFNYGNDNTETQKPQAHQEKQHLTDSEIYKNAQKQELPDYIHGSIYGILNQNSSFNY
ncbi:hypothetical protein HMPREF9318_01763 [Streptococcus urinalis FB127-CNA-2]|uniref:Uncharacterized protein n=1 Tax=Streptococcus urinalis 2285-97 TaxID=764291 RepID=G5KE85_9STRE|nr:hypothetical protein [Streptococcus urinalis]EHJ57163.1 hypothetical protein STRUR_2023 [Streptococcus urinalis 2285-97]EKS18264.1 hypothetical protein HMPREF9318_01763 [Streptococcus urinalis FB127-CNA-2]VEF32862.1 exported protein [Streptococcus urinalis]